jgi:Tat protein translocase TatB subunit
MPQLSPLEILVVSALALIVFGPEKLPQIARTIGRGISELRRMASDVKQEFEVGLNIDDDEDEVEDGPRVHRPTRRSGSGSTADEAGEEPSRPDAQEEDIPPASGTDQNDQPPTEAPPQ